jgi:hypothetical protein
VPLRRQPLLLYTRRKPKTRRDTIAAAVAFSSSSFQAWPTMHTRSVSVPSSSHSNETGIEEQLQNATSSPSPTIEIMVDGLTKIGTIFSRIDESLFAFPTGRWWKGSSTAPSCYWTSAILCKRALRSLRRTSRRHSWFSREEETTRLSTPSFQSYARFVKSAQKQFKKINSKDASDMEVEHHGGVHFKVRLRCDLDWAAWRQRTLEGAGTAGVQDFPVACAP